MNQAASRQTAPDIAPPVVDGGNQEPISVPVDPVLPDPVDYVLEVEMAE